MRSWSSSPVDAYRVNGEEEGSPGCFQQPASQEYEGGYYYPATSSSTANPETTERVAVNTASLLLQPTPPEEGNPAMTEDDPNPDDSCPDPCPSWKPASSPSGLQFGPAEPKEFGPAEPRLKFSAQSQKQSELVKDTNQYDDFGQDGAYNTPLFRTVVPTLAERFSPDRLLSPEKSVLHPRIISKSLLMVEKQKLERKGRRINLLSVPNKELFPAAIWDGEDDAEDSDNRSVGKYKSIAMSSHLKAKALAKGEAQVQQGRLSRMTFLLFVLPSAGFYGLLFQKLSFMKAFYTDDYPRASLGVMAFFMVLAVLIDAFTDPWFASVTDNWVSPLGRRRPFLLVSCVFTPLVFSLGYLAPPFNLSNSKGTAPPTTEESDPSNSFFYGETTYMGMKYSSVTGVWFGIWHIMTKLADTLTLIPIKGLGNELTSNYEARTTLWSLWDFAAALGVLLALNVMSGVQYGPNCMDTSYSGCTALPFNTLIFGIVFFSIPTFCLCKFVPERDYRLSDNFVNDSWYRNSLEFENDNSSQKKTRVDKMIQNVARKSVDVVMFGIGKHVSNISRRFSGFTRLSSRKINTDGMIVNTTSGEERNIFRKTFSFAFSEQGISTNLPGNRTNQTGSRSFSKDSKNIFNFQESATTNTKRTNMMDHGCETPKSESNSMHDDDSSAFPSKKTIEQRNSGFNPNDDPTYIGRSASLGTSTSNADDLSECHESPSNSKPLGASARSSVLGKQQLLLNLGKEILGSSTSCSGENSSPTHTTQVLPVSVPVSEHESIDKKRLNQVNSGRKEKKPRFHMHATVPNFIQTSLNEPFRILLVAECIGALGREVPFAVLPYVINWVIGEDSLTADDRFIRVAGVRLLSQMLCINFWNRFAQNPRVGKFRAHVIGSTCLGLSLLAMYIMSYDMNIWFMCSLAFAWGGSYASQFLLYDLTNEVIEYDTFLTGQKREGLYVMMLEFLPKFMELPSQAIPFMLFSYYGYDADRDKENCPNELCQPEGVILTIKFCFSLVPGFFALLGLSITLYFPLRDKWQHQVICQGILEHSRGNKVICPIFGHITVPPASIMDIPDCMLNNLPDGGVQQLKDEVDFLRKERPLLIEHMMGDSDAIIQIAKGKNHDREDGRRKKREVIDERKETLSTSVSFPSTTPAAPPPGSTIEQGTIITKKGENMVIKKTLSEDHSKKKLSEQQAVMKTHSVDSLKPINSSSTLEVFVIRPETKLEVTPFSVVDAVKDVFGKVKSTDQRKKAPMVVDERILMGDAAGDFDDLRTTSVIEGGNNSFKDSFSQAVRKMFSRDYKDRGVKSSSFRGSSGATKKSSDFLAHKKSSSTTSLGMDIQPKKSRKVEMEANTSIPIYEQRLFYFWPSEIRNCVVINQDAINNGFQRQFDFDVANMMMREFKSSETQEKLSGKGGVKPTTTSSTSTPTIIDIMGLRKKGAGFYPYCINNDYTNNLENDNLEKKQRPLENPPLLPDNLSMIHVLPEEILDFRFQDLLFWPTTLLFFDFVVFLLGLFVIIIDIDRLGSKTEGPGGSVLGLMVVGMAIVHGFYNYKRYDAGTSLIRELENIRFKIQQFEQNIEKNIEKEKNHSISIEEFHKKVYESDDYQCGQAVQDAKDFILQVHLILVWLDCFQQGHRHRESIANVLRKFWHQNIPFDAKIQIVKDPWDDHIDDFKDHA